MVVPKLAFCSSKPALLTWDRRGRGLTLPLSHKPRATNPGQNRVTSSPQARVTRPAHLCPRPHVTKPRRGGASPVLSTQTHHVTGAGAQARVQRPRRPTTPFLLLNPRAEKWTKPRPGFPVEKRGGHLPLALPPTYPGEQRPA